VWQLRSPYILPLATHLPQRSLHHPKPNSALEAPAQQLLRLLPHLPATQLLLTTLPELTRRDPESLALSVAALEPAVRKALGGSLTGPLLSQLLRCADAQAGGSNSNTSSSKKSSSRKNSSGGGIVSAAWAEERMHGIAALLGPELAFGALQSAPALILLEPSELASRVGGVASLLGRSPVEAALIAGRHAQLLAAPRGRVAAAGEALIEGLEEWLGWRRNKAMHFLAWNPAVLAAATAARGVEGAGEGEAGWRPPAVARMGEQWDAVKRRAVRRVRWRAALERVRYPLLAAILCGDGGADGGGGESGGEAEGGSGGEASSTAEAGGDSREDVPGAADEASGGIEGQQQWAAWLDGQQQRLERLQYCAESGALPLVGLRRVLLMHPVEFVRKCPGYRGWRLQLGQQQEQAAARARAQSSVDGLPPWWGESQIEVLGELGPYDRL